MTVKRALLLALVGALLATGCGDEDEAARAWQSLLALDAEGDAQTLWLMEALDSGDPC